MNKTKRLLLLPILLCGACTSISGPEVFQGVAEETNRTTGYEINWDSEEGVNKYQLPSITEGLDLDTAIRIALQNSPELQLVFEDFGVQQAEFIDITDLENPSIGADLLFPLSDGDVTELGIDIGGQILSLFLAPKKKLIREYSMELASHDLSAQVLSFISQVHANYLQAMARHSDLELDRRLEELTQAAFETANRMRAAGNIRGGVVKEMEVDWLQSELAVAQSRHDYFDSIQELALLLNISIDSVTFKHEVPGSILSISEDDFVDQAMRSNYSLKASLAKMKMLGEHAGVSKLESYLGSLHGGILAENKEEAWSLGPALEFSIPLFNQGQAKRKIAAHRFKRAEIQYKTGVMMLEYRTRSLHKKLRLAEAQMAKYQNFILPAIEVVAGDAMENYNAMQIGVFDLLEAKKRELDRLNMFTQLKSHYSLLRGEADLVMRGLSAGGQETTHEIETRLAL